MTAEFALPAEKAWNCPPPSRPVKAEDTLHKLKGRFLPFPRLSASFRHLSHAATSRGDETVSAGPLGQHETWRGLDLSRR